VVGLVGWVCLDPRKCGLRYMMSNTRRFTVMSCSDAVERFGEAAVEAMAFELDFGWILVDNKKNTIVGSDGGEPEDQLLVRDWSWVADLLNEVHEENEDKTCPRCGSASGTVKIGELNV